MDYLNINVPKGVDIAVVGDIHEHEIQFNELVNTVKPSDTMWVVSVGDLYHKGFGVDAAERITDTFKSLNEKGHGAVIKGNHELKELRKAKQQNKMTPALEWLDAQPLALSFVFDNGTRLTVVHGGVSPKHSLSDLKYDIEICYTRDLDENDQMIQLKWVGEKENKKLVPSRPGGVSWHNRYDGRFGYIIAGHEPQTDGKVKHYNFSCNVDTACYSTGILSTQIFNRDGLKNVMQIHGPAGNTVNEKRVGY